MLKLFKTEVGSVQLCQVRSMPVRR